MILAVSIAAGIASAAFWLFIGALLYQTLIRFTMKPDRKWWAIPAAATVGLLAYPTLAALIFVGSPFFGFFVHAAITI